MSVAGLLLRGAYRPNYIALALSATPSISVYPWSNLGFGAKLADPASLPSFTGTAVAWSPNGDALALVGGLSPFVEVYAFANGAIGAKFANPATLPSFIGAAVAFHPAGTFLAVGDVSTPNVSVYPWSTSGFGTKLADPGTSMAGVARDISWTPSGDYIAVASDASFGNVGIVAYPFTGAIGAGVDAPAIASDSSYGAKFSPDGTMLATVRIGIPILRVWNWNAGFGSVFADPGTAPTGAPSGVAWHPTSGAVAVSHAVTPFVTAYPVSGGAFGAKYTNPGTLPAGDAFCVAFSRAGSEIAIGSTSTPFIQAYPFTVAGGFGAKFANPATLPSNSVNGVAFI